MWQWNNSGMEIYHWGIKGMKWGVRRYKNKDGTLTPAGIRRYAKQDAEEYANAKMFYGEGAGNRRKLINATVKQRSKQAGYKEEFERQLAQQDMVKAASRARTERKAKDAKKAVGKASRSAINIAMGNVGRASASAAAVYAVAHATGIDKKIGAYMGQKASDLQSRVKLEYTRYQVNKMFQ